MFRARAWRVSGGFHEDELSKFTYAEDFLMALRLSLHGEIRSVPEVLYRYRVHTTNITLSHDHTNRSALARAAAQAIINQMGLEDEITVITPYIDKEGLVGYIINNIDN